MPISTLVAETEEMNSAVESAEQGIYTDVNESGLKTFNATVQGVEAG